MLLMVHHVTRYNYDQPVRGVVQSHRLTPSGCQGQKVLDWSIVVTDGLAGGAFRDGAGDWVQGWSVAGPVREIVVTVKGRVETQDMAGVLRGHREVVPPQAYLRDTTPTRADAVMAELSREAFTASDALGSAHAMSALVAEAVTYRPGATEARTTAAEALSQGEGVCQDMAHALIGMARFSGLPARYVSGYLHTATKKADAAHAWAEVFVDGLGWVGFDPANRCCPDDRYIRLGSGFDAQDAAPIRGSARSPGRETLDVTVAVQQEQQ